MTVEDPRPPSICFVGLNNLPALAPEFRDRGTGGAELQQTLLAKALVRRGFAVSMIVADLGQPDGAEWDGVKTFKAYRMDAGIPGPRFIHPRWTGLWSAMKRSGAEIRYCSCAGPLPGQLVLFAKYRGGQTVFRVAHDTDCERSGWLIPNWQGKALYRYGLPRVDLILAQTAAQQKALRTHFGRASVVIPSLVELSRAQPPFESRDLDLLWVSNIRPFKRPDVALDLATQLPEAKLHMIGGTQPGALDYFEAIRRRAATLANVLFHGPLAYDDTTACMARARVFVNTSQSEGFPNTFLQSWTRGTPVVTFFDPDGVVAREGLGRVVRSLDEMKLAIRELLTDRAAWAAASARCSAYVSATHGEQAVASFAHALSDLREKSPRTALA
jgi:glycosyltransferase involved in cell wall biosynthesis